MHIFGIKKKKQMMISFVRKRDSDIYNGYMDTGAEEESEMN